MKTEFKLTGDGDRWGNTMNWLFNIADEIYFNRNFEVPVEWEFKPSCLGPSNDPEDWVQQIVISSNDVELLHWGKVLNRYADLLRKHGKDY